MVSSAPENTQLINLMMIALGMGLTVLIAFAVLHAATSYVHLISQTALDAFTRIMGFLLVCIAVQFVLSGVTEFIRNTSFGLH
jgi:multiple antibiotic resistance protein